MEALQKMDSNSNVEELHQESIEWLSEVSFIKQKLMFLRKLLTKNTGHFPTVESAELDKELIVFNSNMLSTLLHSIREHEMWLSDIFRTDTPSRLKFYRELHDELGERIKTCRNEIVAMKKRIFAFAMNQTY